MTVTATSTTRRWPVAITAILVAILAVVSFGMSFVAMQDLTERAGFAAEVAWGTPVIVDGTIVAAMVYLFARRGGRRSERVWPWLLLVGFAVVSVVCNGVHTSVIYDPTQGIALPFAIFLGMLPPVALLGSSELLVRLLTPSAAKAAPVVAAAAEDGEGVAPHPAMAASMPVAVAEPLATTATGVVAPPVTGGDADGDDVAAPVAPVAIASPDVADPSSPPVAAGGDGIATTAATGDGEGPRLHVLDPAPDVDLPTDPAGQVEWVADRAQAGEDATWRTVANVLGLSDRQAQRRVTDARRKYPEAFAA